MTSAKALGIRLYSQLRFGGEGQSIRLEDRTLVTQSFNAMGKGLKSDVAVVLLPGFTSIPNIVPPGVVGQVARERGADFVRFFHPDLLDNRSNVTYDRMIDDAVSLVDCLPHQKVVLAGSSFGAGMMPLVRNAIEARSPRKVAGMFGWMSVPPAALLDLFRQQKGWDDINNGKAETLTVHTPTMPKPFVMSQQQLKSVADSAHMAEMGVQIAGPFNGPALFLTGSQDPVGRPQYTRQMGRQLGSTNYKHEVLECGHRIRPEQIARGLQQVLRQV